MTRDELRLAIAEPAARNHVTFEGNLVEIIIDDFLGQAGSLPLLQYTLDFLWERDKELDGLTDQILNLSTYKDEEFGGVAGALQKQANRIYNRLTEVEQKIAQNIFLNLVDIVDEKRVSKPVELVRFQDGGVKEKVVNTLVENRLLVRGTEESDTRPIVQVAHEELLRSWGILDTLFKDKEEILLLRRRLLTDANQWQELGKKEPQKAIDELWGGSKLARVQELQQEGALGELGEVVDEFIAVSITESERVEREQQEQIDKLNRALTESQLREKAARVLNLLPTQPLDALILAILGMGENMDKLPDNILTPVQSILCRSMKVFVPMILRGHEASVNSVAFSPDSKIIASASADKTIRLWDLQGNTIGQPFRGHEFDIYAVTFSPDGKTIVSAGDKTLRLWDLQGNTIGQPFRGHESGVFAVAFSPDGKTIVSGGYDKTLRLWDLNGNLLTQPFRGHEHSVTSVAFSPDGKLIVSSSHDNSIRLWDLQGNLIRWWDLKGNLNPTDLLRHHHKESIKSVAFHPYREWIVSGSYDGTIHLWNLEGKLIEFDPSIGRIKQPFQGHNFSDVYSVAFSADGEFIVSGEQYGHIRLWDLQGNLIGQFLEEHSSAVNLVTFSPDGKTIVSGGEDGTVRVWNLECNVFASKKFRVHDYSVNFLTLSPDGKMIASGDRDGRQYATVRLWNLQAGNLIGEPFREQEGHITSVAFSPDSKMIVSGSDDGTVRLWNLRGHPIAQPFQGHKSSVRSVAFNPDGNMIVSGSDDGTLRLWDLHGNLIEQPFRGHERLVRSVAFNPDGNMIVSGSDDGTLRLWGLHGNPIGQPFEGHKSRVSSVAFNPDGNMIVSGSDDGILRLWDLHGNPIGQPFEGHKSCVSSVAFSPDGKTIISSEDIFRGLRLWDLQGNPIGEPFGLIGSFGVSPVFTVSPDGQIIVTYDCGHFCLWRGHWLSWLKVCCNRLKHHPAFTNSQTEDEKRAYDIAYRYVFNPQIGADKLYYKARQKLSAKDYTAAADILTLAIQLNPDHIQAYRDRASVFGHLKQYYRGIKDCDYILTIHPYDAEINYIRGLCYAELEKPEQAKADYQQAMTLYEQQGNLEQAQKIRQLLTLEQPE